MVYDFACPWCYVGQRRLVAAMDQRPSVEFVLNWRPFQLNPDMPREGINRRDYYRNKFGADRVESLRRTLDDAGAETGIVFCDMADAMAPNTLSAHVLMFRAGQAVDIDANLLIDKLYEAHHVACENIGDLAVLARIAGEVGMDSDHVLNELHAGTDEDRLRELMEHSSARSITGVPFFIINEQYGISGAQSPESLVAVFDQAADTI